MSVYKEINQIIENLHEATLTNAIYTDSLDSGLPVSRDSSKWHHLSQTIKSFAVKGSRIRPYQNAHQITIATRHNEHAPSDHKSYYEITYITVPKVYNYHTIQPCDGYYTIRKVMPAEHELLNTIKRMEYDARFPNGEPDTNPDMDPAGGHGLHSHA